MRDTATPWAGTAANAAVVRNRTASDACVVTDGIVYQTRNTYVRSQAGALLPSDALQRVVGRNRAQASAFSLGDGFIAAVTEPALVTSGISMHIIPIGSGNIDSRYPRAYGDMLYIADGAAMSDSAVSRVWSASGLDKNLHIGHDPGGDIDSAYVYTPPVNHAPLWTGAPTSLTFTQGIGGTRAFGTYASDPDADALMFSLIGTAYSGISISATTGLLTITSSAVAAVRQLTLRVSDPDGLYADHACAVTIAAQSGAIKWNPGFYIYLPPHEDNATTRASNLAWFQNYANNSTIKGFYIQMYLSQFETGTTASYTYTTQSGGVNYGGFAMLDYYLGLCSVYNKRLALEFENVGFGRNPMPAYWQSQGWTFSYNPTPTYPDGFNIRANHAINACRDRIIAMLQAYALRYNNHPLLEVVGMEETTVLTPPQGATACVNNYKAILTAAAQAWTRTMFRNCENGHMGHPATLEVYQHVEALNNAGVGCIICGGPDHEDGLTNPFDPVSEKYWKQLWRGQTTTLGVTYKDVRGVMPFWGETQERGFINPNYYQDTAANCCSYHIDFMRASHVTFLNYTKWSEVYAAITARNGVTVTTPPSVLAGRTITGGVVQNETVVVTGSSTISLWNTIDADFAPQAVIEKGYSGTTLTDMQSNLQSWVLQYNPTVVGIYQGDNDIAGGTTPAALVTQYRQVLQAINAARPACRCYVISIKPSPARWSDWPDMQTANGLLQSMCNEDSRWYYINASDVLLDGNGDPITAYYDPSGTPAYLHLSDAGYDVWAPIVVDGMGF